MVSPVYCIKWHYILADRICSYSVIWLYQYLKVPYAHVFAVVINRRINNGEVTPLFF